MLVLPQAFEQVSALCAPQCCNERAQGCGLCVASLVHRLGAQLEPRCAAGSRQRCPRASSTPMLRSP